MELLLIGCYQGAMANHARLTSISMSFKTTKRLTSRLFISFILSPVNLLFYNDNETVILFKMTVLLVKWKKPEWVLLFFILSTGDVSLYKTNMNITPTAYLTKIIPIKNTAHNLILCYIYINKCSRMSFTYLH